MFNCTLTSLLVSHLYIGDTRLTCASEWVAGDHSSVAQWEYDTTSDGISYHRVYRQTQLEFSETADQADWGYWYWATKNSDSLTYQSGVDTDVRGTFQSSGKLPNTKDTNYRPINQDYPVFGFSSDLGSVTESVNTLYTIGVTQDQAIQFDGATGIVPLASLWTSYFSSETDAVSLNFLFQSLKVLTSLAILLLQRLQHGEHHSCNT